MPTREQSIALFKKNCDDLIASNYILANKKISVLLKAVSSSKLFVELFEFCAEGFDYEETKRRSIVKGLSYGSGRFVMPSGSREIIAFVFLLLCEIDLKELDFMKLLETCFYEGGYNESFKRFSKEVLVPFKNEVIYAVEKMISGEPESRITSSSVKVQKAVKPVLNDESTEKIKALLNQSRSIILQYKMDTQLKTELMALYDDFSSALYGTDAERLKLSFFGYKYSTLYHRKLDVSVGEIETILKENGIIDGNG